MTPQRAAHRRWARHIDVVTVAIVASMNLSGFFISVLVWRLIEPGIRLPGAVYLVMPALGIVEALPLYWRRRRPLPVLLTVLALYLARGMLALSWLGGDAEVASGWGVSVIVALYATGLYAERRDAWIGLAAGAVALGLVEGLTADPSASPVGVATGVVIAPVFGAVLPWVVGYLVRTNRGLRVERARTATKTRDLEAERARRAMAEERARIARELHDVIAHHVGVMVIQAGAGLRVMDRDPERARASFRAIQEAGRTALTAMPAVLGALRNDGRPGLAPVPSLRDLDALVEQVEAAGLTVERVIAGTPHPLPPDVELAAYRVLQEALTNVLKHAGPVRAAVTLAYLDDRLEVTVRNPGSEGPPPAPVADAAGHGLLGMRERVELLGGALRAAPLAGGGFEVAALLPVAGPRSATPAAAPGGLEARP